jgi:DmsE family decaheme c-type cytochrome
MSARVSLGLMKCRAHRPRARDVAAVKPLPSPKVWVLALLTLTAVHCGTLSAQERNGDATLTARLCNACHLDKFDALGRNPHAALFAADWQERTGHDLGCLACHGDVTAHIAAGGGRGTVRAFRDETVRAQNDVCLGCHRATHPTFDRSPHARAGLACTSCHSQHGGAAQALLRALDVPNDNERLGVASRLCFDCHGEPFAELKLNERHRLREGVLECTSCHDPHAPTTRPLLGGFKQGQCADCHADKSGPFVFEHGASRTEGCTACHAPHGSPNRHLLAHQRVAELCFSCHAAVPQFHAGFGSSAPPRFGLDTQCTSCHSAIHGSNFHPFFLR